MTEPLRTTEAAETPHVARLAIESVQPFAVQAGDLYEVTTPAEAQRYIVDLEKFLPEPKRTRGTVYLHNQQSFAHFVNEHKVDPDTHLYADRYQFRFTAVFNDAGVTLVEGKSSDEVVRGWGDHRAVLALKHTKEWERWAEHDGQLIGQEAFAEHIEDNLDEIVEPDAAYVLELAQTFYAHTGVEFRQAHTLASGERQFQYVETTQAGAGRQDQLTIPKEIVLGIAPFEGTQPYRLVARLRYRLAAGKLALGYKLTRPEDVEKTAFEDATAWIGEDTGIYSLLGSPPERLNPPERTPVG